MSDPTDRPMVDVVYGSQTGNAELIAMDVADAFTAAGTEATLRSMDEFGASDLAKMDRLVIVSSTYDDGDMPDNAQDLWDEVGESAPDLSHARYAVLALGDSSYDDFCAAGRNFDEKLAELGARRVLDRVDCDLDYERPSKEWIDVVVSTFTSLGDHADDVESVAVEITASSTPEAQWTRTNPFVTTVVRAERLSGEGSRKSVYHYEVELAGSDIEYAPGDSLALVPVNPDDLVTGMLAALDVDAGLAAGPGGTWGDVLAHQVELRLPNRELVAWAAEHSGDAELEHVVATGERDALDAWLWGRDVLDLVTMVPRAKRDAGEVLALLGSLQHRSYSISSSPTESPKQADLLVSTVQYHRDGRDRVGAGSSSLLDACPEGVGPAGKVAVFLAPNPSFRPAADDRPMIMVGPGVGVAPFRSFLRERRARGATGRNWLFFGDQHAACDFHYREEVEEWRASGLLTDLTTAFSRDQDHKVYVQDHLVSRGADVFAWLEDGASFYVCGDGADMSRAVESALVEVVVQHGGREESEARDYVADLKRQRRYAQDVY